MKPSEYVQKAKRTEIDKYKFEKTGDVTPRIEHAILGLSDEAGEMINQMKKAKIYGGKLDKVNIIEEMGDMFWFLALLSDEIKVSFEEVWNKNIEKLKARYPEKYTDEKALKRNLEKERKELEK